MPPRRSRPCAPMPALTWLALSVPAAFVPAGPSRADASPLPSIVAEHVRRHVPSGTELVRVRVELSPAGLRVRERSDGLDLEMLQEFAAGRLWFIDRSRRIAHRVELDGPVDERSTDDRAATSGGLLGTVPCEGLDAVPVGDDRRRGRTVSNWHCLDADGTRVASERVDVEFGIVVRRETSDGLVDELHDIRERVFPAGHFSPPSRFRRVDERELVLGAPAIAAFDKAERPSSSPPGPSVSRDRPHNPNGAGGGR